MFSRKWNAISGIVRDIVSFLFNVKYNHSAATNVEAKNIYAMMLTYYRPCDASALPAHNLRPRRHTSTFLMSTLKILVHPTGHTRGSLCMRTSLSIITFDY
jgi:hypothetical protein